MAAHVRSGCPCGPEYASFSQGPSMSIPVRVGPLLDDLLSPDSSILRFIAVRNDVAKEDGDPAQGRAAATGLKTTILDFRGRAGWRQPAGRITSRAVRDSCAFGNGMSTRIGEGIGLLNGVRKSSDFWWPESGPNPPYTTHTCLHRAKALTGLARRRGEEEGRGGSVGASFTGARLVGVACSRGRGGSKGARRRAHVAGSLAHRRFHRDTGRALMRGIGPGVNWRYT